MKIRYRNRVTGEARDIDSGSAEETTVKIAVFTVNGESLPLWVLQDEYEIIQAQEAKLSDVKPVFGHRSRRLTPGERAMGLTSYEQKVRENDPNAVLEDADEIDPLPTTTLGESQDTGNPDDDSDAEDDEEVDEAEEHDARQIAAAAASQTRKPRRAPRRAPAQSR